MYYLLAAIGMLIVFVLLGLTLFQERLIFPATRLDASHQFIQTDGVQERTVLVNGVSLSALHYRHPQTRGLVFFLHGNAGNLHTWVPDVSFYQRERYDMFMMDYRGYGKSEGKISSQAQLEQDVLAVWKQIAPSYHDQNLPVVIYGRSIGTYLATYLAQQVQPELLILVSPYTSLRRLISERFPFLPAWILRYPLATDEIIEHINSPVLLLHGGQDKLIAPDHAVRLDALTTNSQLHIIDQASHNDVHSFTAYKNVLANALP